MNPHLHTKLYWNNLKLYFDYDSASIQLPFGKCGKIHILNRGIEIQVENRKYINKDQICNDKNCKKTTTKKLVKKNNTINPIISELTFDKPNELIDNFTKKFIETIDEFAETYLEKLLRIRKEKKYPKNI